MANGFKKVLRRMSKQFFFVIFLYQLLIFCFIFCSFFFAQDQPTHCTKVIVATATVAH